MGFRAASNVFAGVLFAAVVCAGMSADARAPQAVSTSQAYTGPTFTRDVAPILYKNCVSCHRPGDIAPMSLLSFEEVRPYARPIRTKVSEGTMPPWHAQAAVGTFKNDRRLTPAEKETIVKWVDAGAPQGDPSDMPPAPAFTTGWSIGRPDVVLTMPRTFDVPASGEVRYQYFELPTDFTEDKWVQAIELRPGALSVVHHILAFAREPNATAIRRTDFTPRIVPADAPADVSPSGPGTTAVRPPGLPSAGGRGFAAAARSGANANPRGPNRGTLIATTAPGTNAQVFEPGQAMLVKAGSIITFQVHYTASGKPTSDRSSIGFVFAKQPARQEVCAGAFMNTLLSIPPEAAIHRVDSAIEFNVDSKILSLFPHTHIRGKSWEYRMVYPDGRSEVVLAVPKYDFNWQTYYDFTKPLIAPKGSRLEATAYYDNSVANKANPDPKTLVRWGEQTWEEMQYTGITYMVDDAKASTSGR